MTIDQFVLRLREVQHRFTWDLGTSGKLIRGRNIEAVNLSCMCPITAVCLAQTSAYFVSCNYQDAAKLLKLDPDDAYVIARAADSPLCSDRKLRDQLLGAIGLKERAEWA